MKRLTIMLLITALILTSCSSKEITCEKPYIKAGEKCCLDQNNNRICDSDDARIAEYQQPEKETTIITPEAKKPSYNLNINIWEKTELSGINNKLREITIHVANKGPDLEEPITIITKTAKDDDSDTITWIEQTVSNNDFAIDRTKTISKRKYYQFRNNVTITVDILDKESSIITTKSRIIKSET